MAKKNIHPEVFPTLIKFSNEQVLSTYSSVKPGRNANGTSEIVVEINYPIDNHRAWSRKTGVQNVKNAKRYTPSISSVVTNGANSKQTHLANKKEKAPVAGAKKKK
jgi:hypothetical protein